MRSIGIFLVFSLLVPDSGLTEELQLDPSKHPVSRRTLRMTYVPPSEAKIRVAFFDADSTLRVSKSGSPSANGPRDVLALPLVASRLMELNKAGYVVAIVSNQAGIPKYVSLADAEAALKYTIYLLNEQGASVDYYDFAETSGVFRKPATGMADLAAHIIKMTTGKEIDWSQTIMVGDSSWTRSQKTPEGLAGEDPTDADRAFAENLAKKYGGVKFEYPAGFFGWTKYGVRRFNKAEEVAQFFKEHPELVLPKH